VQLLHVKTTFLCGCMFIAPNWHALMHHPQPLHAFSSTRMIPVFSSCDSASLGHAATHAGSSQCLHVIAKFTSGPMRMARMRDLVGLKVFSFTMLQAYSQTQQPMHFSGSAVTNFLSCGRTILMHFLELEFVVALFLLERLSWRLRRCMISLLGLEPGGVQLSEFPQESILLKRNSRPSLSPSLRH